MQNHTVSDMFALFVVHPEEVVLPRSVLLDLRVLSLWSGADANSLACSSLAQDELTLGLPLIFLCFRDGFPMRDPLGKCMRESPPAIRGVCVCVILPP